jgi:hypothetical protein
MAPAKRNAHGGQAVAAARSARRKQLLEAAQEVFVAQGITRPPWTTSPSGPASPNPFSTNTSPASSSLPRAAGHPLRHARAERPGARWRRPRTTSSGWPARCTRTSNSSTTRVKLSAGIRVGPAQRAGRARAGGADGARLRGGGHRDHHVRYWGKSAASPSCSPRACVGSPETSARFWLAGGRRSQREEAEQLLAALAWRASRVSPAGRRRARLTRTFPTSDSLLKGGSCARETRQTRIEEDDRGGQDRRTVRAA